MPDFDGNVAALETVLAAGPEILNHNTETVPRLYPRVRHKARYGRSLDLLRRAAAWRPRPVTKSGIMLGLGETREEVQQVLCDLRAADCDVLTVGQYLRPSAKHLPVARFVRPTSSPRWPPRRGPWASSTSRRDRWCARRTTQRARFPAGGPRRRRAAALPPLQWPRAGTEG